jgi:hypothetical protein
MEKAGNVNAKSQNVLFGKFSSFSNKSLRHITQKYIEPKTIARPKQTTKLAIQKPY